MFQTFTDLIRIGISQNALNTRVQQRLQLHDRGPRNLTVIDLSIILLDLLEIPTGLRRGIRRQEQEQQNVIKNNIQHALDTNSFIVGPPHLSSPAQSDSSPHIQLHTQSPRVQMRMGLGLIQQVLHPPDFPTAGSSLIYPLLGSFD